MNESDLPLFPEVRVGWRSWTLENGRLYSVTQRWVWPVGEELRAVCDIGHNRPPRLKCGCGIYALQTLHHLRSSAYFRNDVFGKVSLWGRVLEADDGYRAEFAYPKVLYVSYLNYKMVEPLSVYGVPVKVANPYTRRVHGNRLTQTDH
jgi:hypothetical protein